jgi:hypothetical protein
LGGSGAAWKAAAAAAAAAADEAAAANAGGASGSGGRPPIIMACAPYVFVSFSKADFTLAWMISNALIMFSSSPFTVITRSTFMLQRNSNINYFCCFVIVKVKLICSTSCH